VTKSTTKALIIYDSKTGNTEKVAGVIQETLIKAGVNATLKRVADAAGEELYDYDLVILGTPTFQWLPSRGIQEFINQKLAMHGKRGDVKLMAPVIPGKKAVVFCTYSSPFTGIESAFPCVKYLAQFFKHIGFEIAGEWYVIGEFHGNKERSTRGKLGDIRGRPNQADLDEVRGKVTTLLKSLGWFPDD
jgi:multimeric flavodoxin WrbA